MPKSAHARRLGTMKDCLLCSSKHPVSHRRPHSDSALDFSTCITKERAAAWTIDARNISPRSPNGRSLYTRTNLLPEFERPQYPEDQPQAAFHPRIIDTSFSRNFPACNDTRVESPSRRVFGRHLWRIARQREKILQTRSQLAFEQKNLQYANGFEHESIQQLMDVVQDAVLNRTMDIRFEELNALYDRCQNDRASMRAKESQVLSLQADLDVLEYRLMEKEREFALSHLGHNIDAIGSSGDASTDSPSTSTDVPSLLERYYDRKGEVGVQLERLHELEDSYQEEKIHRDIMADRDEPVFGTEEELRLRYEKQRQHILDRLAAARWDAHDLEVVCHSTGLLRKPPMADPSGNADAHTVNSWNLVGASHSPSTPDPGAAHEILNLNSSTMIRGENKLFNTIPRQRSKDSSTDVLHWLQDICTESPSGGLPSVWQHPDIEALDLASATSPTPEARRRSNSDRRWHCRCSSNEGIAHSANCFVTFQAWQQVKAIPGVLDLE